MSQRVMAESRPLKRSFFSRELFTQWGILAVILVVWELIGRKVGTFFMAGPSAVFKAAGELIASGELQSALGDSLLGLATGLTAAAIAGITIGYLMGWFPSVARILNPYVSAFYVLPIQAMIPVIIIWLGIGNAPRILCVFLFSLFEIIINTYTGVKNVEPTYVEVGRSFGANQTQLFSKVVAPHALPFIFAGLRIGCSRAVKGMVVAELMFAVTGLGGLIATYSAYYRTDCVFVVVLLLTLLGVVLNNAVLSLEKRVAPWQRSPQGGMIG